MLKSKNEENQVPQRKTKIKASGITFKNKESGYAQCPKCKKEYFLI